MGAFAPHHEDPVEICSAPRRRLEDIESHEDLKAFWSRNDKGVEDSRRAPPGSKTDRGEHYADILAALYQRRIGESATREKIKKIRIKDPQPRHAPPHQLPRPRNRQRRQEPNLDRRLGPPARRHPQETPRSGGQSLHNSTDSQRDRFLENAYITGAYR